MRFSVICSGVMFAVFLSGNALAAQSYGEAKRTVADYQKLREACTDATGAKRLECMTRLSTASDTYREAKVVVAANASNTQWKLARAQ